MKKIIITPFKLFFKLTISLFKDLFKLIIGISFISVSIILIGFSLYFFSINELDKNLRAASDIGLKESVTKSVDNNNYNFLIIGSDKRSVKSIDYSTSSRSDLILLVRIEPNNKIIKLWSLPRDWLVNINGYGYDKINNAYAYGGSKLLTSTITKNTGVKFNYIFNLNFNGFSKMINQLDCVYTDIDRSYYNRGNGYAKIDIKAGYQRLCGEDSLSYVRYRHTDNDFVRANRQQAFLNNLKGQLENKSIIYKKDLLFDILSRYTNNSISSKNESSKLVQLFLQAKDYKIKSIKFNASDDNNYVTAYNLNKMKKDFKGSDNNYDNVSNNNPESPNYKGNLGSNSKNVNNNKNKKASNTSSLKSITKNFNINDYQKNPYIYKGLKQKLVNKGYDKSSIKYPLLINTGIKEIRIYNLVTVNNKKLPAYRIVYNNNTGFQAVKWKDPYILKNANNSFKYKNKKYYIVYNGNKIKHLIYKKGNYSYWISNSLDDTLSNKEMINLALSSN